MLGLCWILLGSRLLVFVRTNRFRGLGADKRKGENNEPESGTERLANVSQAGLWLTSRIRCVARWAFLVVCLVRIAVSFSLWFGRGASMRGFGIGFIEMDYPSFAVFTFFARTVLWSGRPTSVCAENPKACAISLYSCGVEIERPRITVVGFVSVFESCIEGLRF
jgi:hypothetical protein